MNTLWNDLRYGARMLMKHPGFTLVAVITLVLGIGANTAIFSVVNAVLLRPLPYRDAGRIVVIEEISRESKRTQVTPANFVDWRNQNAVFEHLAAIFTRTANLAVADESERLNLAMTSANFFDVFGVQATQGRLFIPEDEQAGHPAIVVISHGLWQRRFGGEAEMVGKAITLDGNSYTVAGIAPAGFQYPDKTDVWVPPFNLVPMLSATMNVERARGFGFLSTAALLKPGVSLEQAKAEMETITARLREQYPEANNNRFDRVVTLHTHLVGDTSNVLWLLLGAVGFVLLIACANVANLMLVRATSRQKEIAIRNALGATRLRIVRQLLTESLLLALIGGGFGLLLGLWGVDLLTRLLPKDFPRLEAINLDFSVFGFTILVSLITGVVFGFAPAWQVSRNDVNEALKENSRGAVGGVRNRLRSLFVVTEVALSLVLLVGAGLLFRSFLELQAVNTGFNPQQVLTMKVNPSGTNYHDDPQYIAFYKQVEERIQAISGVETVGMINTLPLYKGPTFGFRIEGRQPLPIDQWPTANYRNVSPDYFRALNIPIMNGRAFENRDNLSAPNVALINQATADADFAGENPVGKRINFGGTGSNGQPIWFEIIGVVSNVRSLELQEAALPEVYTASWQDAFSTMSFVIRTTNEFGGEPTALSAAVRQAVHDVDKAQPVSDIRTMENVVSDAVMQPRFNLILLGIFGGIALLLSASGIYGVMAYTVSQRTHEIGIRMALGAQAGNVLRMVMKQGLRLTLIGIALGLLASVLLTRYLSSLLFGVSATDAPTFTVVALFLAGVALVACFVPARRASRTDPMEALRYE